jgi:hypothetical protein
MKFKYFQVRMQQASFNQLHGAELFLKIRRLCSHSRISQHLMQPEFSLPSYET